VLAEKGIQLVPQILVAGSGGALDGLAATLTKALASNSGLISSPSKDEKA